MVICDETFDTNEMYKNYLKYGVYPLMSATAAILIIGLYIVFIHYRDSVKPFFVQALWAVLTIETCLYFTQYIFRWDVD